ncbi:hypothetical protein RUM44_000105 [Polyplax serrata]|uniref:Uncharacterized protein n=1 Tax=Polyplax serrata TaxID=468196 RepID=A0ABR1B4I5_POLSC
MSCRETCPTAEDLPFKQRRDGGIERKLWRLVLAAAAPSPSCRSTAAPLPSPHTRQGEWNFQDGGNWNGMPHGLGLV